MGLVLGKMRKRTRDMKRRGKKKKKKRKKLSTSGTVSADHVWPSSRQSGDWGDRLDPWKVGKSGRSYDYGAWQYGTQKGRRNRPAGDFTPWRGLVMTG